MKDKMRALTSTIVTYAPPIPCTPCGICESRKISKIESPEDAEECTMLDTTLRLHSILPTQSRASLGKHWNDFFWSGWYSVIDKLEAHSSDK